MCGLAESLGVPVVTVAGEVEEGAPEPVPLLCLTERFGPERARAEPAACVEELIAEHLTG